MNRVLLLVLALLFNNVSVAQEQDKDAAVIYDCTRMKIEQASDQLLTKKERLQQMDSALYQSIDRYDNCVEKQAANGGAAEGGNGGAGAIGSGTGQGQAATQGNSVNASQTENNQNNGAPTEQQPPINQLPPNSKVKNNKDLSQNKVVAPKDNDSIVCKQIWEAIQQEADAGKKQGLIDIYTDYECGK